MSINQIFTKYLQDLETDFDLREDIRIICKQADQLSREIMTVMQPIHQSEEGITPACMQARIMFEKARESYAKLAEVIPHNNFYKFHEQWRTMTQRYVYLITLTIWLEMGFLASPHTVADILGIKNIEERNVLHLDLEDYLCGVMIFCSELARLSVTTVARNELHRAVQIYKCVAEINSGFRLLPIKSEQLKKRCEHLRFDLQKIEAVIYDLQLRNLVPKPGDEDSDF